MSAARGLALVLLAAASACDDPLGPGACTTEAIPGITVDLRQEGGGPLPADDVFGRAVDPEQPRVYALYGFESRLYGAHEAVGTYTVTVEKPGFTTWVREDVRVEQGSCHVITVELEAVLTPAP